MEGKQGAPPLSLLLSAHKDGPVVGALGSLGVLSSHDELQIKPLLNLVEFLERVNSEKGEF